ncbi:hypothetical protein BCR34DRAFT_57023 [Clohesyomyces aquaticus]|uniref:Uncharacterized protein n=1 Tax=Clohesyomyces aquaticus TaxID=1231657 RepID=A0A1Y1Z2E9_9PLEO|nr:hypothetical protein BCR34DRAFT_57023 [Clohesyomyces aquaticus]
MVNEHPFGQTRYEYTYIPRAAGRGYYQPQPQPAAAPAAQPAQEEAPTQPAAVPYPYFYYCSRSASAPEPERQHAYYPPAYQYYYPQVAVPAAPASPAANYTYAHVYPAATQAAPAAPIPSSYLGGRTRDEVELDARRIATACGAYEPRKIKPADAKADDPFWCREKNGDWHLRPYYTIEKDCQPGRWKMDGEKGYLVFIRE